MSIDSVLFDHAVSFIKQRYPSNEATVAAMKTSKGNILTSVSPETKNDALSLCAEVGACLEAHKWNERPTHSICLYHKPEKNQYIILSPCGICCERLSHWGGDIQVAISNPENKLLFKPLRELLPHHWSLVSGKPL